MKDLSNLIFKNLKLNSSITKNKELKFLNDYLFKESINFELDEFKKKKMDLEIKKIQEKIQTMVDQRQSNPDAITQWLEHDNVSLEHQWSLILKLWCCKNSKNDPQIQAWTSQFQNRSLQNKGHLGLLQLFQSAPWNESSWSPWVSFLYDLTHECIQHQTKDLKQQQKLLCDTYRHWAFSAASTQCWSYMEALLDPKLVKHQDTKGASIHHHDIESESISKPPLRL